MPRTSAEEKAAAFYRAAPKPIPAPKDLSRAEAKLWVEIIDSRPADWWDAGALGILRIHVAASIAALELRDRLAAVEIGSAAYTRVSRDWTRTCTLAMATARQLRLTVQHAIRNDTTRANEKVTAPIAQHPLVTGRVDASVPN